MTCPPNVEMVSTAPLWDLLDDRWVRVVYGLIDPRRPTEIAYVGKTENHVIERYLQHLRDGLYVRDNAPNRHRWLSELRGLRQPTRLCIIEPVGSNPRDLVARETFWIVEYQSHGQAWINQQLSRSMRLKALRGAPRLSSYLPAESVG